MKRSTLAAGMLLSMVVVGAAQAFARAASERDEIAEMYAIWGRARVEVDRETLAALLAPDFRLLVDGTESSREEFLDQVTRFQGARLKRFDVDILTLQRDGSRWTAVIAEKLEWERPGADGKPETLCNLWVTRDVCGNADGEWRFHSSEAIGNETWPPGVKPPVRTW